MDNSPSWFAFSKKRKMWPFHVVFVQGTTKGLFTWREVVPGRRVTLPPPTRAIFYRAFIWKKLSLLTEQNLALSGSRMLYMSRLVPGMWNINSRSVYMEKSWPAPQGHPTFKASTLHPGLPWPRANFAISHVNGSLLFVKKCMKSSLARGYLVWRVAPVYNARVELFGWFTLGPKWAWSALENQIGLYFRKPSWQIFRHYCAQLKRKIQFSVENLNCCFKILFHLLFLWRIPFLNSLQRYNEFF